MTHARSRLAAVLACTAVLSACRTSSSRTAPSAGAPSAAVRAHAAPVFPPAWPLQPGRRASIAPHGMIASNSPLATQAGVEILEHGGNAVDAAVATGFALAVTFPEAGNLGGGGFMVIRMADGRTAALDYREVAPLAASRNMYLDSAGKLTKKSLYGGLASGVPGSVAGMVEAQRRYGRLTLAQVMAPAIRLARDGFTVDAAFSGHLHGDSALITHFAGRAVFFPDGKPLRAGTHLELPALARTLEAIAREGARGFYTGPVADSIVAQVKRDGGIFTAEDLAAYKPVWREPVRGTFRGDSLFAMPPSSSGGITTVESLNILETWPALPPFGSAEYVHDVAEAFRRAFVDRNTKLGDPAFVQVPTAQLTSKAYAQSLRSTIQPERASKTPAFSSEASEGTQTTHYSVVDSAGNAVATTTTINSYYGSGVFVPGAGIFMNNEMDDFAAEPGKANQFGLVQGEANAIAPGKRPLSAMSPTIVLDHSGKVLLVVGAAGGPTIITATTQVILNVVEHHMDLADAMAAPRIHQQAWPDLIAYEHDGLTTAVIDSLRTMGYQLRDVGHLANANAVMRVSGGWAGVVEPRATGAAAGY